jgi:hypothetical protein
MKGEKKGFYFAVRGSMIYAYLNHNHKKFEKSTKIKVEDPTLFNEDTGRFTDKYSQKKNVLLQNFQQKIERLLFEAMEKGVDNHVLYIKSSLENKKLDDKNPFNSLDSKSMVYDALINYVNVNSIYNDSDNRKTRHEYSAILKSWRDYELNKKESIRFCDLDENLMNKIFKFLEMPHTQYLKHFDCKNKWDKTIEFDGYSITTLVKRHGYLMAAFEYINKRSKVNIDPDVLDHKINKKKKTGNPISLTYEEVIQLYNYQPETPTEELIKDFTIISMGVGANISDIEMLTPDRLKSGENEYLLDFERSKTTTQCYTPITPLVKSLFDKYNGNLKLISQRKYNAGLKAIMRKLPAFNVLDHKNSQKNKPVKCRHQLISHKVFRKTYITLSKELGAAQNRIMERIGHKDMRMTSFYMSIRDVKMNQELRDVLKQLIVEY